METRATSVLVKRYHPEDEAPFYQTYELRFHNDMTVLDALTEIKDADDGTLTFRWSCRMGICGSCAMTINGKPVLACQTYMRDVEQPVQVEPLRNFPVVKDLVVNLDDAFEKMRSTKPYIDRLKEKGLTEGEYLQSPEQRKKIDQTSQCIKCMICYSACPVYGLDKNFMGPAAGALAYRYTADSREKSKRPRIDSISGEKGMWKCSFVGECSAACPKRVDPALSLQRLKVMGALRLAERTVKGE
ncbi:succinate dehydrogenase/fumarate reductase iron-sulfur subunit [Candidatus Peregrinibacteria bacterium CG_4_9_14_0_2_um_filter_53_11]|nr:MAG: succinate dehydrogenase/fumarate reductase iron-sulfur subunit [Candidatus Peregrinibacteria bacterium CG_4_9_14_0_2_um_filter_53_11]